MTEAEAKAKWMAIERPLCFEKSDGTWCLLMREGHLWMNGIRVPVHWSKCGEHALNPVVLERRYPTCKLCCKILNGVELTGNDMLRRAVGII